jgi:hypothetical protein
MVSNQADALVNTWQGHTQRGGIDDYERSNQMRSLLRGLAPEAEHAIVIPMSGDSEPPKGAAWLSHEIVVLGADCIYRFAGLDGVSEGSDKSVFSVATVRVPFSEFERVQVLDIRTPGRDATRCRQRWDFLGSSGRIGLSIWVECWAETGWDGPDIALVHNLARALGWPIKEQPASSS